MIDFSYTRATSVADALRAQAATPAAKYLGGGTNLVDLMRENVERAPALIDVRALPDSIDAREDGTVLIGAGASNTTVAGSAVIRQHYPVLAQAILSGASAQIRNMATVGGNILQRTRCAYFYDSSRRCNKRTPDSGCDAIEGLNRAHAILGASSSCIATHPSDMCVALAALDARVHLRSVAGSRVIGLRDLHRLPGATPDVETNLRPGELIEAVELPAAPAGSASLYRKVRDRASYAFALVSVAAIMRVERGTILEVRLALGGVAHRPWRCEAAEAALSGRAPTREAFEAAAAAELEQAQAQTQNGFKIELAKRTLVATLEDVAGRSA
ncbi:FAD binding domain-containing protein [Luteimonas abyssi]|uniref:FAD binding domain-containing protein n=1 Tax=Luteimonas abyssi TaxID=1247514 RepID=UPI000737BDC6|nr:xanthine dehydrogenase family protein subunit M [Luteimonas abyssi]